MVRVGPDRGAVTFELEYPTMSRDEFCFDSVFFLDIGRQPGGLGEVVSLLAIDDAEFHWRIGFAVSKDRLKVDLWFATATVAARQGTRIQRSLLPRTPSSFLGLTKDDGRLGNSKLGFSAGLGVSCALFTVANCRT